MPRNAEETMKALERVLPIFYRATLAGVREVNNGYSDTAHIHRQTTKSSLRRDHIVHILRGDLADDGGVHIDDRNQTTYFLIDREFHLLAKKSDELGSVALNDTQAALGFHCNEQQARAGRRPLSGGDEPLSELRAEQERSRQPDRSADLPA